LILRLHDSDSGIQGSVPQPSRAGIWLDSPAAAAVYAIAYKPEPEAKPDKYAVIYVGQSDDLARSGSRSSTRARTAQAAMCRSRRREVEGRS
jgi:hypothetical protein